MIVVFVGNWVLDGRIFIYSFTHSMPPSPKNTTAFQVTTNGKSWFMKTQEEEDPEVLNNWVAAIRGAIARWVKDSLSPYASL